MSKPNVLFILADDLGYADLSCYGRLDYKTPHLDKLASNGIKFTQGYANSPVCSATRVSLITGNYQYRYPLGLHEPVFNEVFDERTPDERAKRFVPLPTDINTLPREFQKRGYSTHLVGKWHLGTLPHNGPRQYGYDSFFGFLGGATDYFRHRMFLDEDREKDGLVVNDEFVEREGYLTDLLGNDAVTLIEEQQSSNKPFFASLHFNAPHWPWEGPDDAELAAQLKSLTGLPGNIRKYGEIVKAMDRQIGRVVEALERTNQLENTIIVFTSDNGGERFSNNWPFIGAKTELLEGGLRVPVIISWPAQFPPQVSEQVITTMDYYPTLLGAVDNDPTNHYLVDGVNLLAVLKGSAPIRSRKLFWRYLAHEQAAVRDGDYKYLKIGTREYLFNLSADERERSDFQNEHPEVFARLKQEWQAWNATMLPYPTNIKSHSVKPIFADRY